MSDTTPAKDPFSLVYDGLWAILENHAGFANLVKVANRIKFSGTDKYPMKQDVSEGDLPEVRLVGTGGTPHVAYTSSGIECLKRFQIQIATGDQRFWSPEAIAAGTLFPVEWEILRAFASWKAVTDQLTWNTFTGWVFLVKLTTLTEGVTNADLNRGIAGWSGMFDVDVTLRFPFAVLRPQPSQPQE